MSGCIDLHLHTWHSDGIHGPEWVLRLARDAGVTTAAISDHDTVAALPEAREVAARFGIRLIPAAEVSVECEGQDLHILGYFLNPEDPRLLAHFELLLRSRTERFHRSIRRLKRLGFPIEPEEVFAWVGPTGVVGRPHLARAMVENGWVRNTSDAFRFYLGAGCPAYVPKRTPSAEESLEILLGAGAVTVLAHPGVYHLEGILERLVPAGLMGLEVYHPSHRPEQVEEMRSLAARWGLLETGGSDYHGDREGELGPGELAVASGVLEILEAARARVPEIRRSRHGSR